MATLAYLDHVDGKRTELGGHPAEFIGRSDSARIGTELIPVDVGDMNEPGIEAGRAGAGGRLAIVPSCPKQVRIGIAALTGKRPTSTQLHEGLPPL